MLCYPRKTLVSPADLGAKSENGTRGKTGPLKEPVNDRLVEACKRVERV